MNNFDLLQFRRKITENNIILLFEGRLSQGMLVVLVDMLKEKLSAAEETERDHRQYLVRKVYAIFVELAQNVQNHSCEKEKVGDASIGSGIILMRENADCFTIISGNALAVAEAHKLKDYCDYINGLNEDALKKLYKEKLRAARREGEKGAGIGLIEIKRKADSPLDAAIQALDEQTVFFTLSVNIGKGEWNG
jgi:hypothetical protein